MDGFWSFCVAACTLRRMTVLEQFLMGVETIIPEDDTKAALATPGLTIKFGADPSAPDIHLGHAVILNKLSLLQQLGHRVQFLIGDFTAMIGDPTGKSQTRKALSKEDVLKNAESYKDQVFKFLDPAMTDVVYNSEWLGKMSAADVVALSSRYTVSRMLERDDFKKRFSTETPISIHEFLYPLFQGYDSVVLKSDIEVGGTDQTFNLLMGRHLQQQDNLKPQSIITFPILEGLDGVQKMSKSLNNHIGVLDEPNDMFGKVMSIPDNLILRYFRLLTQKSPEALEQMDQAIMGGANPRDAKVELGMTIVEHLHSKEAAEAAKAHFETVFAKKEIPDEMPEVSLGAELIKLIDLMVDQGMSASKKEARRMITQGAVSINQEKVSSDEFQDYQPVDGDVIKVGKRQFLRVRV